MQCPRVLPVYLYVFLYLLSVLWVNCVYNLNVLVIITIQNTLRVRGVFTWLALLRGLYPYFIATPQAINEPQAS